MRYSFLTRVAAAATALTVSASVASAQSWQALGPVNGSGGSFWNNQSYDTSVSGGTPCNIGAVLSGVASPSGCVNEAPTSLLPLNTGITQYLSGSSVGSGTGFQFGAGYWEVSLLGTITGATPPRAWTVRDNSGSLGTLTVAGSKLLVNCVGGCFFDISAYSPTGSTYNSKTLNKGRAQFAALAVNGAALTNNAGVASISNTGDGRRYFVGMEDNGCSDANGNVQFGILAVGCANVDGGPSTPYSDYDYNDIMLQVTAVPEPSSIALMAAGLAGLVAAARRRRSA